MRRRRRLALGLAVGVMACLLGAGALALSGQVREAQAGDAPTVTRPESAVTKQESAVTRREIFSPGKLLVTLPWGSGQGEVGLITPEEGFAHGPEALTVAPDGRIAVLDSVNKRVVCLDSTGDFVLAAPVPLTEPRFLAVDNERLYVLDCDTSQSLAVLDWEGHVLEMLVLPELPDVVTGLFATAQGPSVEVAHEKVYLVGASKALTAAGDGSQAAGRDVEAAGRDVTAAAQGVPAAGSDAGQAPFGAVASKRASLRSLPGRPLDRELSRAVKVTFKPATGVEITSVKLDPAGLSATQQNTLRPTLASGRALEHLVSVDSDGQGGLVVGARLLEAGSRSDGRPALALTRIPASASGSKQGTASPVLLLADRSMVYVGQPYVVAPDGRIFQPVAEEDGYSIFVHEFPTSDQTSGTLSAEEVER